MSETVPGPAVLSLPASPGVRAARGVAAAGGVLSVVLGVTALVLHLAHGAVWPADVNPFWRTAVVWGVAVGGPGAVLAWLRPGNPIGWLVLLSGLVLGVSEALFGWAVVALEVPSSGLAFHPHLVWVAGWIWVPGYVLLPTVVLLLVPAGRLPSQRWRPVVAFQLMVVALATLGFAVTHWDRVDPPLTWQGLTNPYGIAGAERLLDATLLLLAGAVLASVASLVVRMRKGTPVERQQLKWVLLGAVLTVLIAAGAHFTPMAVAPWIAALAVLPVMACTTVAVLRYRLWDVETFIARSAIYGLLTLLVAVTYLAVVGLIGSRIGGGAPLLALVLVGLGLQPVRGFVQRQVNRLLYGQRDDPYAVLAALGQRLEGAAGSEPGGEALPGVARTIATALRLTYVGVVVDGERVSSHGQRPAAVEGVPLLHQGEHVGMLEAGLRRGEPHLPREDRQLLADLAAQLAGAVNSLRLTRDLLRSREEIVAAREEERRRLHRDLHDDLGPALAALALQLETARDLVRDDPAAAQELLERLRVHTRGAVDVTRRIVTDLRPVNLDDLGLVGALEELAARFSSPQLRIELDLSEPGPLPAAVDVVLLRVAAESLANVARHSGASWCRVELGVQGSEVRLEIVDDGAGINGAAQPGVGLRSMRERAAEVGGRSTVERLESGGTRVAVALPVVAR